MEAGAFGQVFQLAPQGAAVVRKHEEECVTTRHLQTEEIIVQGYQQKALNATHKVALVGLQRNLLDFCISMFFLLFSSFWFV